MKRIKKRLGSFVRYLVIALLIFQMTVWSNDSEMDRLSEIKEEILFAIEGLNYAEDEKETEIVIPVTIPENKDGNTMDNAYIQEIKEEIILFTTEAINRYFGNDVYKAADLSVNLLDSIGGFVMYWYYADEKDMIAMQMSPLALKGNIFDEWTIQIKRTPYEVADTKIIHAPLTISYGANEATVSAMLRSYPGFSKVRLSYETVTLYTFFLPQEDHSLYVQLQMRSLSSLQHMAHLIPGGISYPYSQVLTRISYHFNTAEQKELISQLEMLWGEGISSSIDYTFPMWESVYSAEKVLDISALDELTASEDWDSSYRRFWSDYESVSLIYPYGKEVASITYDGYGSVVIPILLSKLVP